MKKVLILAYDFPPYVSVGGLRPNAWYKYLKEFNIEPIVVTRQWSNDYGDERDYIAPSQSQNILYEVTQQGLIIRTPYKPSTSNQLYLKYGPNKYILLRKLLSAYYEFAQFLMNVGQKVNLYKAAQIYLKQQHVDCIIATGEPFILFKYAAKLSQKFHIPWIADYRDPWVENENRSSFFIQKKWNLFFERKYVNNAQAIITVSDFCRFKIQEHIREKKFYIIPNGYDPEAIDKVKEIQQKSDVLRFAFVGTIYNWHPLDSVLNVFHCFIAQQSDVKIEINFFGINNANSLKELLKQKYPNLEEFVHIIARMP